MKGSAAAQNICSAATASSPYLAARCTEGRTTSVLLCSHHARQCFRLEFSCLSVLAGAAGRWSCSMLRRVLSQSDGSAGRGA
eukprot:1223538-Prymnesium_polylepis.1